MKKVYSAPQMTVSRFDVAEYLECACCSCEGKPCKCVTDACYWYNAGEGKI